MSKDDHNGLFVDTGLLRDHVSILREEKKLAYRLYENVAVMKAAADPVIAYRYDSVLRDIKQMIEYFDKMAKLLTNVGDEAVRLSNELGNMIQDSTDVSQQMISEKFVL